MDTLPALHESDLLLEEAHPGQDSKQDVATSRCSIESTAAKSASAQGHPTPMPTELSRQGYLLVLVLLYSCLSIIPWAIICTQTRRPITTRTYSYVPFSEDLHLADQMKSNAEWFRAARVLLSVTNTLVIPLTSTVCASAAVIHLQNFGHRRHFSMQHTSTLADKGWTSPHIWLALLSSKGWRTRGSYFLVFAIALHALGRLCVLSPS